MDEEDLLLGYLLYKEMKHEDRQEKIEEIMDKYGVDENEAEEILDEEED